MIQPSRFQTVLILAVLLSGGFPAAGRAEYSGIPTPEQAVRAAPAAGAHGTTPATGVTESTPSGTLTSGYEVGVPILMYHYVAEEWPSSEPGWPGIDNFTLTPAMLRAQIRVLLAYGYTPVSLDDFMAYRLGTRPPPARPVILTFDDGMMNFYTLAAPVMREFDHGDRRVRATMFITTDWVKDRAEDRFIKWVPNGEVLIWPEVRELYAQGFPIESHATEHDPPLTAIPLPTACQRIADAIPAIRANVPGDPAGFFAYPGGAFNADVVDCVRRSGYQAALAAGGNFPASTTMSDLFALPRYHLQNYGINQTHSVVLDVAQPERFFLRILDPGFPLPEINILKVEFLHDGGAIGGSFAVHERVALRITLRNGGATAPVRLIAALYGGDETTCSVDVLDAVRHDAGCASWDELAFDLPAGATRTVTFSPHALAAWPIGQYYLSLDVRDGPGVMSYQHAARASAFEVVAPRQFLPWLSG